MAVTKHKLAKLCKERMANELERRFEEHPNFIITSYMGSSVADLELLRRNLKKSSSQYSVVKNSILKVVFDKLSAKGGSGFGGKSNEMTSLIDGGMGISFSGDDLIATCKALVTFAKDHEKFKIKGAVLDGLSVLPERVKMLGSIPSKNILMAQVVGGMKAPITGFVNVLGGLLRKFVYVVNAIKDKQPTSTPGV